MRTTLLIQQLCVCSARVLNCNSPWQALIKIKGKLLEIGQAAVDIFVDKDPQKKADIFISLLEQSLFQLTAILSGLQSTIDECIFKYNGVHILNNIVAIASPPL